MTTRKRATKVAPPKKAVTKAIETTEHDFNDFDNLDIVPGDFAELWDFEANDILDGFLENIREVETVQKRGKKTETKVQRIAEFKLLDGGKAAIFESHHLSKIFHPELFGQPFRIVYKGKIKIKGGRQLKQFEVRSRPAAIALMESLNEQ